MRDVSPERWQRLESLFTEISPLERADRDAALARVALDDPELAFLLARMIHAAGSAPARIAGAIDHAAGAIAAHVSWVGRRFGPYEIVREIGRGGMGVVFEAHRADDGYRQRVALKIAPDWRGDPGLLDRFRAERQILSELESDNIARFFDGGTEDGIPYFAMELVDGRPITRYCEQANVPLPARLRLFQQVCHAVEFAHGRLVVHRDLKPANILVTPQGVPKLVDFGVAKVLNPATDPGLTMIATPAWTPDYVSPEQVRGRAITARTDVYSLGLVLYELVCGEHGQRGDTSSLLALDRSVCETEPERPTDCLARLGDRARARAAAGDLETVILKAIRKDPNDRYHSVAAFAADIGRVLEHRPIHARQITGWQRVRKFVRRHRAAVAAGGVMVLIASVGLVSTVLQARRAERRFQQVRALANTFVFDVHDRIATLPGATEARHAIVTTALTYLESLRSDAGGDPSLSRELAAAYEKVGAVQGLPTLSNLGDTAGALRSFELAQEILRPLADSGDADARYQLASTLFKAAIVQRARGAREVATATFTRAYETGHALLDRTPHDPRLLELVGSIEAERARAAFELRDFAAAERSGLEAMALGTQLVSLAPANRVYRDGVASAHNSLGAVLIGAGKLAEAAAHYRASVAIREQLISEEADSAEFRRELAISYGSLADVLGIRAGENLGDTAGAIDMLGRAAALIDSARRRDPNDRRALYDLANVHVRMGAALRDSDPPRLQDALNEFRTAEAHTKTLLAQDPGVVTYRYLSLVILRRMGDTLDDLGRASEAKAVLYQARTIGGELTSGPNGPSARSQVMQASARLALVRAREGAIDAAVRQADDVSSAGQTGSLGSPIVDAALHATLGRTYLAAAGHASAPRRAQLLEKASARFDDSARLWREAKLSPALEAKRATALAVLAQERARAASTILSASPR